MVTEYGEPPAVASSPLAICRDVVLNWKALPHRPFVPPETLLHETRTADAGTVEHDAKFAVDAATESVQVLNMLPPLVVQLTVAGELPGKLPRSGSVAVKLMVLGAATALFIEMGASGASGVVMRIGVTDFFCAAA